MGLLLETEDDDEFGDRVALLGVRCSYWRSIGGFSGEEARTTRAETEIFRSRRRTR